MYSRVHLGEHWIASGQPILLRISLGIASSSGSSMHLTSSLIRYELYWVLEETGLASPRWRWAFSPPSSVARPPLTSNSSPQIL